MTKIKFAIIGCGNISYSHARAIKESSKAELIAVSSRNEQRREILASKYGCMNYADHKKMMENADIDAVIICTPSGTHAQYGIDAAKAGKHVMVEKPMEISLEAADRLIEACKANNVKLSCISQSRFGDGITKIKKAIDTNKLGNISFGAAHTKFYRSQKYYDSSKGRGTFEMDGGGALMIQGYHYLDLLHYLVGEIDEVSAYAATLSHKIEVEDVAVAAVKFKSGALGLIEANTAAFPGFYQRLDVYGDNGSVILENSKIKEWRIRNDEMVFHDLMGFELRKNNSKGESGFTSNTLVSEQFIKQADNFCDAIAGRESLVVTPHSARHTLAVILSIYESALNSKSVKIL